MSLKFCFWRLSLIPIVTNLLIIASCRTVWMKWYHSSSPTLLHKKDRSLIFMVTVWAQTRLLENEGPVKKHIVRYPRFSGGVIAPWSKTVQGSVLSCWGVIRGIESLEPRPRYQNSYNRTLPSIVLYVHTHVGLTIGWNTTKLLGG